MPCPSSHLPVYAVTLPSAAIAIQESTSFKGGEPAVPPAKLSWASAVPYVPAKLKVTINAPVLFRKDLRERPARRRAANASGVNVCLSAAFDLFLNWVLREFLIGPFPVRLF